MRSEDKQKREKEGELMMSVALDEDHPFKDKYNGRS